jgi:predicted CoA-binding protein
MPIDDDKRIADILKSAKTIAVVGASPKPWRDSSRITQVLMEEGYEVFPVNPNYHEVFGKKCYPDLESVPSRIDIVDIFRNPDQVDEIIENAIAAKAGTVWMQLGVVNEQAAQKAEEAGLQVVMDHCIAVDHARLIR